VFNYGYIFLPLPNQYVSDLSDDEVSYVIEYINEERLTAYLRKTENRREALKLYALNAQLAKHVHELIGGFEVALRNAVSASIIDHYDRSDWYRARSFVMALNSERRANIREVRKRLAAQGRSERSGRIVAGLTKPEANSQRLTEGSRP